MQNNVLPPEIEELIAQEVEKARREQIEKDATIALGIDEQLTSDEYHLGYYDARKYIHSEILNQPVYGKGTIPIQSV